MEEVNSMVTSKTTFPIKKAKLSNIPKNIAPDEKPDKESAI